MSDSMDSFDSLANTNTPGDDPLPPDLAPLHERVLQDSALWRAGLPGTDALARQVTSLAQRKSESRQPSYRVREELQMQEPTSTSIEPPKRPSTRLAPSPRAAHAHTRGFVAGGAALVLVALFVGFFAMLPHGGQSGRSGKSGGHATATATTPTGHTGPWQPVSGLTHTANVPVISPVNTKVVYDVANGAVRRSSDEGATWTNLPNPSDFPAGDVPQWMDLFVSPLSADTLWTTADLTNPNGAINCPVGYPTASTGGNFAGSTNHLYGAAIPSGGSIPCQVQNVSTDGGRTWKLVKLPFAFMLGSASPDAGTFNFYDQYSATPQIQGNQIQNTSRMYTLTSDGPLASSASGGHVAMSSDGGVTWRDASAQLTSAGLDICDVAAVSLGSTLFAVANANGCGIDGATAPSLWRSDDGGGHWHQVALPPDRFVISLIALGGPDQPTLYAQTATLSHSHAANTAALPTDISASTDGGATWKQAPSQGVPASVIGSGPMTVFGPGNSLVVPFLVLSASGSANTQAPDASTPTALPTPNTGNVPPEAPIGSQVHVSSGSASQMTNTYTFEQWQPGNTAWHPLSHLSLYGIAQFQTLPAPTTGAEAFWLTVPDSTDPQSSTFSVETYLPS